ncbi:MAG TPA: MFS transporter [Gemmataceae bacterium]|nr:MFS transporter [Gemmataceae bacterium]
MKNANDKVLFWASFLTLIAAGIGFSMRGALLGVWGGQFGFTQGELGTISGFGLVGFGITIIALSFITDRIGYGPLMVLAFLLHFSSGVVTLAATPVCNAMGGAAGGGKEWAFRCLAAGGLLFSLANGTCEAVINPLTATLFPTNKTHWLNILHAGWPGGLVLGALLGLVFSQLGAVSPLIKERWEIQMGMFLVPVLIYGGMMIGRRFPTSEAAAAGVGLKTMLLEFAAPVLLLLLALHAIVGYTELGVDNWIQNITGSIMSSGDLAKILFIWTSGLMFVLRFFAGPIVHRISPLGLLFACAVLACLGLLSLGSIPTQPGQTTFVVVALCFLAATVYGVGKTFFWPTMLGVVSERFPKGGALTLGTIGGIGMLSAGLLGAPGIGKEQDYFAQKKLDETAEGKAAYARYVETPKEDTGGGSLKFLQDPNIFNLLFPEVRGLDGSKVATLASDGANLKEEENKSLYDWWQRAKEHAGVDRVPVLSAVIYSGQMALIVTAANPAVLALGYLFLIVLFRLRGGYKAEVLVGHKAKDEEFTGGVAGPAEL